MKINSKNKKNLAREILLFISIFILNGLIFLFFHLRNYYYERKEITLLNSLSSKSNQIDNLPDTLINNIYNSLSHCMVVDYVINGTSYTILKGSEDDFLHDNRTAKSLLPNTVGFSFPGNKSLILFSKMNLYKGSNGLIDNEYHIRQLYGSEFEKLVNNGSIQFIISPDNMDCFPIRRHPGKKISLSPDGSFTELDFSLIKDDNSFGAGSANDWVIFDYVDLQKFKEYLKDSTYRSKFYLSFYSKYNFGTKEIFNSKIESYLKLDGKVAILRKNLLDENKSIQENLFLTGSKILSDKTILSILLWTFIISLLIAYPIRFCFKAIRWSIKTLRNNNSDTPQTDENHFAEIKNVSAELETQTKSSFQIVEKINVEEKQSPNPRNKLIFVGKISLLLIFLFLIFKGTQLALRKSSKATDPAKIDIQEQVDTEETTKTYHSKYNYTISIPIGYCQLSESIKNQITDSILKLQNRVQTKLITEAIFTSCGEDEFPRFQLTFLPVENYENITFRQGISAIINISLATEFESIKSRFNFIDSISANKPIVDYGKQAFLFSSSGQIFSQSPKFLYSATFLCKKGLISISLYCRYPEQLDAARKNFYSIYNSFQIDPNYRMTN